MTRVASLRSVVPAVIAGLILVQAFIAGRHLFGGWGITAHGIVGNVVFTLGVVALVLSLVGPRRTAMVAAAAALVVLLTAQIGLGYVGRTSLDAAAWHVPNGVLTFGLAVYLCTRATPRAAA